MVCDTYNSIGGTIFGSYTVQLARMQLWWVPTLRFCRRFIILAILLIGTWFIITKAAVLLMRSIFSLVLA